MKTRKIPATTITEPRAILAVTLSRRKITLKNAEKKGVVEDIGTACDSGIYIKLNVRKFTNNKAYSEINSTINKFLLTKLYPLQH